MVMYNVYTSNIKRKYRAHFCSFATLFLICTLGLTVICPVLVAYHSNGFWLMESTYREQGDVHFKHQFILFMRGASVDSIIGYSTFSNFNILLGNKLRIPTIQSGEFDTNFDGKNDYLTFTLEVPLGAAEMINNVQLLMFFDYKLYRQSSVQMESMAYLHYDSSSPGAEFITDGELRLVQKTPLRHRGHHVIYNVSIIDDSSLRTEAYDLSNIFRSYKSRNLSTIYEDSYPVWRIGRSENQPFVIRANISYPEEVITFRPGIWQILKVAWIQYLAVLVIFVVVFDVIKQFVFSQQLVETVPSKVHTD